jgi:hypothetical protein
MQPFYVIFSPPDDQWRPPVVVRLVASILCQLHNLVCSILEYYLDQDLREIQAHGCLVADETDVLEVVRLLTAFCRRIRELLLSIMSQITRRLLREERMRRLQQEFKTDSVMWSTMLQKLHHTVLGGPDDTLKTLGGGLLMNVRNLLTKYRMDCALLNSVSSRKKLEEYIDTFCQQSFERNQQVVTTHMKMLKAALEHLSSDLAEKEHKKIVAEYRCLKRDGQTRQFNVYVKNLEGLYDVIRAIVDSANDYAYDLLHSQQAGLRSSGSDLVLEDVRDLLQCYVLFWSCLTSVMRKYMHELKLEFRLYEDEQYLEFQDDTPRLHTRGFSHKTLEALHTILFNSSCTTVYLLILNDFVEKRKQQECLKLSPIEQKRFAQAHESKELVLHIITKLLSDGRVDWAAAEELLHSERFVLNDLSEPLNLIKNDLYGSCFLKQHQMVKNLFGSRNLRWDSFWEKRRCSIGFVSKHFIKLLDHKEFPVAIKWIGVHNSLTEEASVDSLRSLKAEHKYLGMVTYSLLPPQWTKGSSSLSNHSSSLEVEVGQQDGASTCNGHSVEVPGESEEAAAPSSVLDVDWRHGQPTHSSVVVGYGLTGTLPMDVLKKLDRPNTEPIEVCERVDLPHTAQQMLDIQAQTLMRYKSSCFAYLLHALLLHALL